MEGRLAQQASRHPEPLPPRRAGAPDRVGHRKRRRDRGTVALAENPRQAAHRFRQGSDLSLLEPLSAFLGPQVAAYDHLGVVEHRDGSRAYFSAPSNAYRTSDGRRVAISTSAQSAADRLFAAIGRADLVDQGRFASTQRRNRHADEVDELVAAWVADHTLQDVLRIWAEQGVAGAPAYTVADLVADPHVREREMAGHR